jgi:HlyD family secretion protein
VSAGSARGPGAAARRGRRWGVVLLASAVTAGAAGVWWWRREVAVAVQASPVVRRDLVSVVSGSGEIKPRTWVNVSATAYGQITELGVREGDRVTRSQVLARLESAQPAADVAAQRASLEVARAEAGAAEAMLRSAEASQRTARADLDRARAEALRARLEYARLDSMLAKRLASQSDHDAARAANQVASAAVARAEAYAAQLAAQTEHQRAQLVSARTRIEQVAANLARVSNVLSKHTFVSPIDGIVTHLPVHVGENMVMGIQNAPGTLLMTIADMSVITAEVKVDETDIVSVRAGQTAEVSIDAFPDRKVPGRVTEIGHSAILRSSGQATSLAGTVSQEAKDFKVVVELSSVPPNLRPGLSATARMQTGAVRGALAVPVQSVVLRPPPGAPDARAAATGASPGPPAGRSAGPPAPVAPVVQGVMVVRGGRTAFVPVRTGLTGITEIEVAGALAEGELVVTGRYKVLRTLAAGTLVRIADPQDGTDKDDRP